MYRHGRNNSVMEVTLHLPQCRKLCIKTLNTASKSLRDNSYKKVSYIKITKY